MKRWFLVALTMLCVGSGVAGAGYLGPSYNMYVDQDTVVAGQPVLVTSVAIKKNGTRDKAPRLSYRSLDTTVASVALSTTHTATITTKRAGLALVEGTYWYEQGPQNRWKVLRDTVAVTVRVKPDTVIPPPPDTLKPPPFDSVVGGYLVTRSAARALGGRFQLYEDRFDEYAQKHWDRNVLEAQTNPDAWWGDNYYDRCYAYLAMWRRGGPDEYRDKGFKYCLEYRRVYMHNGNTDIGGGSSLWWYMRDGQLAHYLITGDDSTRYALTRQTRLFLEGETNIVRNSWGTDARSESRYLNAYLDMVRIKGHPNVPPPNYVPWATGTWNDPNPTWEKALDFQLERVLAMQAPDGAWRFPTDCGNALQMNFMAGLLNEALQNVYTSYRKDPRIVEAVRKNVEYLYTTQWKGTAFQYTDGDCGNNYGTYLTPDLTGLMLSSFGWLYHVTGDAKYKQWGDTVFEGAVDGAYYIGGKQFNQLYKSSWKYLGYTR